MNIQTVRHIFNSTIIGSIFLMMGLILSMISFFAIYVSDHRTTNCILDSLVDTNSTSLIQNIKNNLARCGTDANSDFSFAISSVLGIFFTTASALVFVPKARKKHNDNHLDVEKLTKKLENGSLTKHEAEELKIILEKERDGAITIGNAVAVIAIGFLIALVVAYLKGKHR